MILLRRVIGDALRARRQAQHRTLREVSTAANVSLGYLSEIERGQKEASSELLSSICDALGAQLSDVLRDVSDTLALAEQVPAVLLPAEQRGRDAAKPPAEVEEPVAVPASAEAGAAHPESIVDGQVAVAVHRDGPLRTTLRATRMPRAEASEREVIYA